MMKPMTICRYEKFDIATEPGTEMKVTPDIAALTIASVATGQGDLRPPVKKSALSALRPATADTANRAAM